MKETTTKAYKLFRLRKNGTLGSLFIDRRAVRPLGEWLIAEYHPTKGFSNRFGWHCTFKPIAPHLSKKNRVWCEVEVRNFETYERPEKQGGTWIIAQEIKILGMVKDETI